MRRTVGAGDSTIQNLKILTDGRFLAVGVASGGGSDLATALFSSSGNLDTSWGGTGTVLTDIGGDDQVGSGVATQSDGKVVTIGYNLAGGVNYDAMLARYLTDGTLDSTFGTGGIATAGGGNTQLPVAGTLDGLGRIVVAGSAVPGGSVEFLAGRFTTAGALDAGFGLVTTPMSSISDDGYGVVVQPDERVIVVGDANSSFGLVRYLTDGTLDSTFGIGGKVVHDVSGTGSFDTARAVRLRADGKIWVGGYGISIAAGGFGTYLARYNSDGSIDSSFNGNGKAFARIPGFLIQATAMATQSDGKVLIAGAVHTGTLPTDFFVVRFRTDGLIDSSFGTNGFAVSDFGGSNDTAYAVEIQSDGKIVAAGSCASGLVSAFCMARYNP